MLSLLLFLLTPLYESSQLSVSKRFVGEIARQMDISNYSTLLTAHEHGVTTITVLCQLTLKKQKQN